MPFSFFTHKQIPINSKVVSDEAPEYQRYLNFLHNIQYISTVLDEQFKLVLARLKLDMDNYNKEQVRSILDKMNLNNLLPTLYANKINTAILEQLKEDSIISFRELEEKFSSFALNSVMVKKLDIFIEWVTFSLRNHPKEEKKITESLKLILNMLCEPSEVNISACKNCAETLIGHRSPALKGLGLTLLSISLLCIVGMCLSIAFAPGGLFFILTSSSFMGSFIGANIFGMLGMFSFGFGMRREGLSNAASRLIAASNEELKRPELKDLPTSVTLHEEISQEHEEISQEHEEISPDERFCFLLRYHNIRAF